MSNYPDSIDTFAPVTGSDEMTEHAERHTAEESSIVAIETALGTSPEGDSDTVADRLDAQDALIADNADAISGIDTTVFATSAEVAEADQLLQRQIDALPTTSAMEAADTATLEDAEAYTDTEVAKIVVPDVSGFATKTEVGEADEATLESANKYTDEEVGKIVIPDVSTFATTTYVNDADAGLQNQIDAIETYDDTDLTATVDTKFTMGGTWGALAGRS